MEDTSKLLSDDGAQKELAESQQNKFDRRVSTTLIVGSLFFLDICTGVVFALRDPGVMGLRVLAAREAPIAFVTLCAILLIFLSYRSLIRWETGFMLGVGLVFSPLYIPMLMTLIAAIFVPILVAVVLIPATIIGFATVLLFSTNIREECVRSNSVPVYLLLCSALGVATIGALSSSLYFEYLDSEVLFDRRYYLTISKGFLDPNFYVFDECDSSGMNCKRLYDNIPIEYRRDNMELDLRVNADEIEIRYADGEIICTFAPARPTENESCLLEARPKND